MTFQGWDRTEISTQSGDRVNAVNPVIISASRATDIPAFFSPWFINRLRAGYIRWMNPFNSNQIQYVSFLKTRAIVFWSKNPAPLMSYLPEIDKMGINYYFQFTLNDYEKEGLEPNVGKLYKRVEVFKALVEKLGKKRVIWRYDPLILTDSLSIDILLDRIYRIGSMLNGYAEKLVISFADINCYKKVQNNLYKKNIIYQEFAEEQMTKMAYGLNLLNREWGLKIATCAEGIDLIGIQHNKCIDDDLMIDLFNDDSVLMKFLGYEPNLFSASFRGSYKDKGQRKYCGCIVSKDIGMYDTCHHLCTYCYANSSCKAVENNINKHNPESESIISS
jgi:DNA repair photolyase